jgi:hypothetical protein
MVGRMTDNDASEDWVAGGTMEASASDLTFFGGSSIPVDTSSLPEPPEFADS